jgi:type IV secretory pathway TraG/TraD family ATPase VirD4
MPQINLLDAIVLALSQSDYVRVRQLIEGGVLILGGLGSGKSSTSLKQIFCALLRAGFGGLLCTVKPEDKDNYIAYARECGREADVCVFSVESGLTFDPLAYLSTHGRGAAHDVEAIIDFFSTLLSIGKQHLGVNNDRFWELASEQAMRHAIHLIRLAGEPLSIVSIYRAIQSYPSHPGEQETDDWVKRSYTAFLINKIRARKDTLTQTEWDDLDVVTQFIFSTWASYDERPRSSIEMTFMGMADKFTLSPFREMFASGRFDFTPEQATHEHKLIVLDIPVLAYGRDTSRLMQILVKLVFQRSWLQHPFKPGCCNGAMLIQDEFQMLMSRFENHFVQVCRSSAIVPVFITQSILNLAEEMGESQPGSKTKAFLNNLSVKIAHNTNCPDTCEYMADVIGKAYQYLDNFQAGNGGASQTYTSVGGARQLAHILPPIELTRLKKPDGDNPRAESIVWQSGQTFNATKSEKNPNGRNYLRVFFSRE